MDVGNQLPILLISFAMLWKWHTSRWESVTNPLDKLYDLRPNRGRSLGISYQSS